MTRHVRIRFAMAAALVLLPGFARAQAPARLLTAIIDVQRILAESDEGKREIARIKKVQDDKLQQINAREAAIQKDKDKLTDLGFSISEDERAKLTRSVEDKMIEADRFRKDADRDIKIQFEEVFASFEKRIYPIIEQIGTERSIQLILNRDMPGLVWADKSLDITTDVIERFNRNPGAAPAAAQPPPPRAGTRR